MKEKKNILIHRTYTVQYYGPTLWNEILFKLIYSRKKRRVYLERSIDLIFLSSSSRDDVILRESFYLITIPYNERISDVLFILLFFSRETLFVDISVDRRNAGAREMK